MSLRSSSEFSSIFESSSSRSQRPTLTLQTFALMRPLRVLNTNRNRLAVGADGGMHGQLRNVGGAVIFLLPAFFIQVLMKVTLRVKSPIPMSGISRSEALFIWSPARTPRPPE